MCVGAPSFRAVALGAGKTLAYLLPLVQLFSTTPRPGEGDEDGGAPSGGAAAAAADTNLDGLFDDDDDDDDDERADADLDDNEYGGFGGAADDAPAAWTPRTRRTRRASYPRALVLVPNRELAAQVARMARELRLAEVERTSRRVRSVTSEPRNRNCRAALGRLWFAEIRNDIASRQELHL